MTPAMLRGLRYIAENDGRIDEVRENTLRALRLRGLIRVHRQMHGPGRDTAELTPEGRAELSRRTHTPSTSKTTPNQGE